MTDKILQFPGAAGAERPAAKATKPAAEQPVNVPVDQAQLDAAQAMLSQLSPDQQKAMQIIMSGTTFVLVGIKPTDRGADFFTAVHGDDTDLRNAQPHLDGVIERAFARKGI